MNTSNPEPYTREPRAWSVLQMEALGALSSTVRDPAMLAFQVHEPVSKLAPDLIRTGQRGHLQAHCITSVINGVVANVVESVPDMLTDRVAAETVDAVTEATVALIVEEINPVLGQGVGEALADTIVPVVGNLSQRVERVLMRAGSQYVRCGRDEARGPFHTIDQVSIPRRHRVPCARANTVPSRTIFAIIASRIRKLRTCSLSSTTLLCDVLHRTTNVLCVGS